MDSNSSGNDSTCLRGETSSSNFDLITDEDENDIQSCFLLFSVGKLSWNLVNTKLSGSVGNTNVSGSVGNKNEWKPDAHLDSLVPCLTNLQDCYIISTLKTTAGGGNVGSLIPSQRRFVLESSSGDIYRSNSLKDIYIGPCPGKKEPDWKHIRGIALCELQSIRIVLASMYLKYVFYNLDSGADAASVSLKVQLELEGALVLLENTSTKGVVSSQSQESPGTCSENNTAEVGVGIATECFTIRGVRRLFNVVFECFNDLRYCRSSKFDVHDYRSVYQITLSLLEVHKLLKLAKGFLFCDVQVAVGCWEELTIQLKAQIRDVEKFLDDFAGSMLSDSTIILQQRSSSDTNSEDIMCWNKLVYERCANELYKLFSKRRSQLVGVWKIDSTNTLADQLLRQREATYCQYRLLYIRSYVYCLVQSRDVKRIEELMGSLGITSTAASAADAYIARWCILGYLCILENVGYGWFQQGLEWRKH